jgi:hypothetical protein
MQLLFPLDMDLVKYVNSKSFSFEFTTLPQATLLYCEAGLRDWLRSFPGDKVVKSCFGFAGKGNYVVRTNQKTENLLDMCSREWKKGRPMVGEPWLESLLNFSSQWELSKEGEIRFLGITIFETDERGTYKGTRAGPEELLCASFQPWVELHQMKAKKVLENVSKRGFFGPIGIDALLYRCPLNNTTELFPIVEINARQTMSRVFLLLQKRYFPNTCIRVASAKKGSPGLSLFRKNWSWKMGRKSNSL